MSKSAENSGIANPLKATIHGMNSSFFWAGVLGVIGLVIAIFVVKKEDRTKTIKA